MWYLQGETLILIACLSLGLGLLRRFAPKAAQYLMPAAQLAALWVISKRLAVFMVLYIIAGLVCCRVLAQRKSGAVLLVCSLGAFVPLFAARADVFGVQLPVLFVSIGVAFHVLRMMDVFFYTHYSGEGVRGLVLVNYMLLLPVFTAGPVFRYRDFQKSFDHPLVLDGAEFSRCFARVIRGLFKKIVVSAVLLRAFGWVTGQRGWYFSLAAICLSYFVLYFDLSGYSDVAIAFGRIMGFDVPENFKRPWRAATLTRFWRAWHSTVSDWIREHVYILMSGRKPGKWATACIALITMVLMSLWHGFHLPFLAAGLYNGILLGLENLLSLTTVPRKSKRGVVALRCVVVNGLFAVNTLVFLLPWDGVLRVLRGLVGR